MPSKSTASAPRRNRHDSQGKRGGSTLGTSMPFNQAQMDTMFDLAQAHSLMRRELMAALAQGRATTKAELYGRVPASVT
jgi:hypothetical protein